MKFQTIVILIVVSLCFQCSMSRKTACVDYGTQKLTEQFRYTKKGNVQSQTPIAAQLETILLDMPLERLSASNTELLQPSLLKSSPELIYNKVIPTDTVPKRIADSLKTELLKAQVELLKLEQEQQQKRYESGGLGGDRLGSIHEKADKLATASLILAILGALLFIPALSAASGGFLVLVLLIDLVGISLAITSLVKFQDVMNKKGKRKAIIGLSIIFGFPLLLFALLVLLLILFWNGF
ncbi:MAG: hypothetical protein RIA69_20690 [Cyclobacteriaceae bacterium]